MIAAPVAVLLTAGAGLFALEHAPLPRAAPIDPGDAVQISVIQPAEPVVAPGERMEVGDLVGGYTHAPIPAATPDVDVYAAEQVTAWLEPAREPAPVAWRAADAAVVRPTTPQPLATPAADRQVIDEPALDEVSLRPARQEGAGQVRVEGAARPVEQPSVKNDAAFY